MTSTPLIVTSKSNANDAGPQVLKTTPTQVSELTFTPKLNATSVRMVQQRRNSYGKEGFTSKAKSIGGDRLNAGQNDFTFKPQMSETSVKIAQNLGSTFMSRQAMHLEKQRKMLEQQTQLPVKFGRLSPVPLAKLKKLKEATEGTWRISTSLPNDSKDNNVARSPNGLGVGTSISMLNPVRHPKATPTFHSSMNLQRSDASNVYGQSTALIVKNRKPISPLKTTPNVTKHKRAVTHPIEGKSDPLSDNEGDQDAPVDHPDVSPVTTMPENKCTSPDASPRGKAKQPRGGPTGERLRIAKITAERAIKAKKIFMIQGPYPVVRECLRQRNYVEKQYKRMAPHKVKKKPESEEDSDDCNDSDDANDDSGCHNDSDEEEEEVGDSDSICGMMSRIVRNVTPTFIWTLRNVSIDFKFLKKDTFVNHFEKNGAFTTKSGLCSHLRNLPWYDQVNPQSFFPRCYKICSDDEKAAFLEDYRLVAATAIIHWVVQRHENEQEHGDPTSCAEPNIPVTNKNGKPINGKKAPVVPSSVLDTALMIVEDHFSKMDFEDIDRPSQTHGVLTEEQWDGFIKQYYQVIHNGGTIEGSLGSYAYCDSIIKRLRLTNPQLDMQGLRNIWIVKPGAKSRGRGIFCLNKLDDLLKLVGNPLVIKEGKWVVQKYIERPLLVYNTKFDIRQWFLVTDWNPLTVWFYRVCYLRFCTQPFTMDDFDASIHLSNQSIQKNYENASSRSQLLPDDNMWDSKNFKEYLEKRGHGKVWDELVYPGMKKAVVSALLCCQDSIVMRKNSFELYGADFMMTDDYAPWLIEINCSPAMGATTVITERLCASVIEDTLAVVLDRRKDKDCDIGKFELAFKQHSINMPIYTGANMVVEGTGIRKPSDGVKRQRSTFSVPNRTSEILAKREENQRSKAAKKSASNESLKTGSVRPGSVATTGNIEESEKKLAESPLAHLAVKSPSPAHKDDRPASRSSNTTLDDQRGQSACSLCRTEPGIRTDSLNNNCSCQQDSIVTTESLHPNPSSHSNITHTHSEMKLSSVSRYDIHRPHSVQATADLIPRSGAFYSNRRGNIVSFDPRFPVAPFETKVKISGFSTKSRVKPNINRQQREKCALVKSTKGQIISTSFPLAITNGL